MFKAKVDQKSLKCGSNLTTVTLQIGLYVLLRNTSLPTSTIIPFSLCLSLRGPISLPNSLLSVRVRLRVSPLSFCSVYPSET